MSDKLSGLESLSVSPPEHRPDISVNDSEDDRSQKRMRGLKDIGIVGKLKTICQKKGRSQVALWSDCVKKKSRRIPAISSGRLFDVPYTGCEPNQTAGSFPGLVTENENAQAVGGPQSGQSSLVETVSAGPDEIQESGSISSGAAGANDINHIVIENGPSEWQHKGKRNLRSCVSYNDNDTISLYDVDIEFQASQLPQDIPYISLMNGVDVEMVSEDSKKSKIRKLSSITCLKKQSETPKADEVPLVFPAEVAFSRYGSIAYY
ncbi:hypothetical protein Tco_0778851 [Tanacetum coccineum]